MSSSTGASSKLLASVAIGLGVTAVSSISYWYYLQWKRNLIPQKWRRVGTLEQINLFPVKSCGPVKLQPDSELACEILGLRLGNCRDRALMVIDDKDQMITARVFPKMVLIATRMLTPSKLELSAPGMPPLVVDYNNLAADGKVVQTFVWSTKVGVKLCGAEYDKWFSLYLLNKESGLRLVYYPLGSPVKDINSRMLKEPFIRKDDRGTFNDATSYMLMNLASIDELNTRIPRPVNPLQFRGGFHLKMDVNEPYAEDHWQWVKIGDDVIFRVVAPCTRCIFPNINVFTAERDPDGEPLKTLKTYRLFKNYASPALGIHLGLRQAGTVKNNDVIYVEDN